MERRPLTLRRIVTHVGIVVLGAYGLYLLLVHLFLATPLLKHLTNADPDELLVEYGSAWSLRPGRVHVRNLRLRLRDSNTEVWIAMDRVTATFDVPALFAKQLRARDVIAEGTSVRARLRLEESEITPEVMEGVAPIPGFADPPRKPPVEKPPVSDAEYALWTVDLDAVTVEPLRELWIGPYRFHGDARVEGGFHLRPARKLALRPSKVEVRGGDLDLAKRLFATGVRGTLEATIAMHDPRSYEQTSIFRHLDATAQLDSVQEDLAFLQRWARPTGITVTGGRGTVHSAVTIRRGVVQDGSVVAMRAAGVLATHDLGHATTDITSELVVEHGEARLTTRLRELVLRKRWAFDWPIEIEQLALFARTRSTDLAEQPAGDLVASLELPEARVHDVRILSELARGVTILPARGSLRGELHLSVRERLLHGEARFEVPAAGARVGDVELGGRIAAQVSLKRYDLRAKRGEIKDASIDLRDAGVVPSGGKPVRDWWGRVDWGTGSIVQTREPRFSAPFTLRARDGRPLVHVLAAKDTIPDWARGPLSFENLSVAGRLDLGPGVALEQLQGKGGGVGVSGRVRKARGKTDGAITLSFGVLALRVDLGGGGVSPSIGGGPKSPP